jgi:hypothetical protein
MINRQHGRIVFGCDACARLSEGGSSEWIELWLQAKREGWRARKIGKHWYQFCGELCISKLADAQIRRRH